MDKYEITEHRTFEGECFILKSKWQFEYSDVLVKERITRLLLSLSAGWKDSNIDFITRFSFLERVHVYSWLINDLTPLYTLPKLSQLGYEVDLKVPFDLAKISSLSRLDLTWDKKTLGLIDCINLEYLNISRYPYQSFNELSNLTKLEQVFVSSRKLETTDGISKFKNFRHLDLYDCRKLTKLTELNQLKDLEYIEIESCHQITNWETLADLKNLKTLKIMNCRGIKSVEFLRELKNLETLMLIVKVDDGDLSVLKELPKLSKVGIADRRHHNISHAEISAFVRKRNNSL